MNCRVELPTCDKLDTRPQWPAVGTGKWPLGTNSAQTEAQVSNCQDGCQTNSWRYDDLFVWLVLRLGQYGRPCQQQLGFLSICMFGLRSVRLICKCVRFLRFLKVQKRDFVTFSELLHIFFSHTGCELTELRRAFRSVSYIEDAAKDGRKSPNGGKRQQKQRMAAKVVLVYKKSSLFRSCKRIKTLGPYWGI